MKKNTEQNQSLDWNAKIVRFFFHNSRLVLLIAFCVIIGGIASLMSLRREGFPNVTIKSVAVQSIYPGATAGEVETKVTKEIESSIKDVKGVKDFESVSQNSFSQIMINFDESVNIDQAIQDVQSKISSIKGNLPKEVEQPKFMTISTSGPSFVFAVSATNDGETESEANKIANELETLNGVKKVEYDKPNKNIRVELISEELQKRNIPISTITQLLQANNVDFPTGSLVIDGKKQSTISYGAFSSILDIQNLMVGFDPIKRTPVLLKDIAVISEKSEASELINQTGLTIDDKLQSKKSVLVQVTLTDTVDIIKTKEVILSQIEAAKADGIIGKDTVAIPVYDQGQQSADQINEIIEASVGAKRNLFLLGGFQLLFIAMLLLVNWRAAFVSALSLPLALAFTFISLRLTGTQLNTIVLFSLVLVLGLIVDPAIVMIEAIQRYRDLKYSKEDAVIESGRRYGASIFMAVLTSLIVFFPFGVVSGYFGQIIKYLPLTVIPALLASYFVPIAILPFLTKKLLHEHIGEHKTLDEEENLSKAAVIVMNINRWALSKFWHKAVILLGSLVLIGLSISLIATGKIEVAQFSTPEDNPMLQVQASFEKSETFAKKEDLTKELEGVLLKEKSIKEYYIISQNAEGFSMFINLKDEAERKDESEKSKEIAKRIKEDAIKIEGFDDLVVDEISMGPPGGNYQIQTQLATNDLVKLEEASKSVGKYLAGIEHVIRVDDGFTGKTDPEIQIVLNRQKVETAGLSSFEIGTQLKSIMDESEMGKLENKDGESSNIILSVLSKPMTIDAVKKLPLVSRNGKILTVNDVADVIPGQGVGSIERYNGARFATVKARVDQSRNVAEVQSKLDDYLTKEKLKELGIDNKLNKGDIGDITKSFTDLGIALLIAILLTYIVLVLQFKSFSLPLIMLFTIPLSLIGVFPALWLANNQFGFLELLGITILVGIVENVAIFLIDYANQLIREKGMSPKEAIIQASGVRFRPILLTKLVALGGLLPLAIESPFWRGLSLVIIAGIGLSGFFSLIVIPVLYTFIMNLRMKRKEFEI